MPDSGVIVNAQQVTPAGVQSVFDGRVGGVRFGKSDDDIWVAVAGSVYHLAWRDNRVISSASYPGHPGVQAVAVDPATGRAAVSTVGRGATNPEGELPGGIARIARSDAVQLAFFDAEGGGVSGSAFASGAVGDYAAGAPAIARTRNTTGHRVAVLPLTANDRLTVIDADRGTVLKSITLGVAPIAAVVSSDGSIAWVTNLGGAKPKRGDRSATECCYERAERVRIDRRGIAEPGSVVRVDLVTGKVTNSLAVGRHPTALAWDTLHARLYVANGNDESISVIDTREFRTVGRLEIGSRRYNHTGEAPTALAIAPDGQTLYVAVGALNAVAVFDVSTSHLRGLIPTGWYPSSVDV
ncbi:MAG TPA: YncE family protein, partial [Candidatus Tumulicola sp.]|nr:YncE family protein [Candidatus Tumulicola sp.]